MAHRNQQNPNPQQRDEQKPYQQQPGQQILGQQNPQNPSKQSQDKGQRAAVHGSDEQYQRKQEATQENTQSQSQLCSVCGCLLCLAFGCFFFFVGPIVF